jgi:hypothetical protein
MFESAVTYKVLKPHVTNLIWHVAVPTLAFSAKDEDLWSSDPKAFAASQFDILDSLYNPRQIAAEFLATAMEAR